MPFLNQSNRQLIKQLQTDVDNIDTNEYTATFPLAIDGSNNITVNLDSRQPTLTTSTMASMGTLNFAQMRSRLDESMHHTWWRQEDGRSCPLSIKQCCEEERVTRMRQKHLVLNESSSSLDWRGSW
jgi:hypothetical protein